MMSVGGPPLPVAAIVLLPRFVPVAEAMVSIVLADHRLRRRASSAPGAG